MPETFVAYDDFPAAFALGAAHLVEQMIEAAQIAAALRRMQADAQREGIALPPIAIPDLGNLLHRAHPACKLAKAAIAAGILDGTEGVLADTAV